MAHSRRKMNIGQNGLLVSRKTTSYFTELPQKNETKLKRYLPFVEQLAKIHVTSYVSNIIRTVTEIILYNYQLRILAKHMNYPVFKIIRMHSEKWKMYLFLHVGKNHR